MRTESATRRPIPHLYPLHFSFTIRTPFNHPYTHHSLFPFFRDAVHPEHDSAGGTRLGTVDFFSGGGEPRARAAISPLRHTFFFF